MDAIRDFTWLKHLQTGTVIERFTLDCFKAVALRISSSERSPSEPYRYRILFFPDDTRRPVLSLNLELSILGSYCLTEQLGARHITHDTVEEPPSYDEFKQWALKEARRHLTGIQSNRKQPLPAGRTLH